ncbi:MAG: protoporphyrinogen oxidase [Acidobacteriota bacterium]
MRDTIIIGAGISGLVAAYRLKSLGIDALLIESSDRAGGVIRSETLDGYLIERGPNSSQRTEELLSLVEELGIADELIEGDPKAPAYIYFNGELHAVPMSAGAFLKSRLLSARGKLRLIREFFVPPRKEDSEESVFAFAERRIGREGAERMISAFVSGVYAGDAKKLSVQAAFPKMVNLETGYGGLFRGMFAKAKEAKKNKNNSPAGPGRRRSCSFRRGMSFLTDTLAESLGEDLILNCSDIDLRSETSNFKLSFNRSGIREEISCKSVIISTPAFAASRLVAPLSEELSRLLDEIEYPPLAIVYLAYDESMIRHPLRGFGFLAAPSEGLSVLGCVWNSSLFEGRAPEGKALMTVFIGGARNPAAARLADDELVALAHGEIQRAMKIQGEPHPISITRYERAIPQYNLGHAARVKKIDELIRQSRGLYLAGNYLRGPSTGDCAKEADRVAREAARSL